MGNYVATAWAYSPKQIRVENKIYTFDSALHCVSEQEENYFVIRNEMLDIIGTGETIELHSLPRISRQSTFGKIAKNQENFRLDRKKNRLMAALDAKKTEKNLKKKGFIEAINKSPDHIRLEFYHKGKLILGTKLSHNGQDLNDYLIKQMAVQCQLSKEEFKNLAQCPLSQENYLAILAEKGVL